MVGAGVRESGGDSVPPLRDVNCPWIRGSGMKMKMRIRIKIRRGNVRAGRPRYWATETWVLTSSRVAMR